MCQDVSIKHYSRQSTGVTICFAAFRIKHGNKDSYFPTTAFQPSDRLTFIFVTWKHFVPNKTNYINWNEKKKCWIYIRQFNSKPCISSLLQWFALNRWLRFAFLWSSHGLPLPLTLFEQARKEIGMLIMDHKKHNGNDLNGFIVLYQIGFNWIMDTIVETRVEENTEHGVPFVFYPINYTNKV